MWHVPSICKRKCAKKSSIDTEEMKIKYSSNEKSTETTSNKIFKQLIFLLSLRNFHTYNPMSNKTEK